MRQKVFRKHQLGDLKKMLDSIDVSKILLVRGKSSFINSGAGRFIDDIMNSKSITSFSDFSPNPNITDLRKGTEVFKSGNFEIIIAIGGGSVMDMGKLISIFAHQSNNFEDIIKGKQLLSETKTPLLAIPTTAGSGAEATRFAVVYIGKNKFSVESPLMRPDFVYLDAAFSESASAYLTACSGADAFCQAVESVWSVNANEESVELALQAIEKTVQHLNDAVHDNDRLARAEMQEAAFLAGKAISITKTTAPHALSYAFTSFYGIPHGHAVALSLPFFMDFNYALSNQNCTDRRGSAAVKNRMDKIFTCLNTTHKNAGTFLNTFFSKSGLEMSIKKLIPDFNPDVIVDHVNFERLRNNPRVVVKTDIIDFLKF